MSQSKQPEPEFEVIFEHRRCDHQSSSIDRCRNIVTHWAQPKGYAGPVYCVRHGDLAKANRGVPR